MAYHYVLVADASRARLIAADPSLEAPEEIEAFVHPQGRQHERDLLEGGWATNSTSNPTGHGRGGPRSVTDIPDPHEEEAKRFVRTLARRLSDARNANEYEKLILVASPKFLGLLRATLDRSTAKTVVAELDLNVGQWRTEDAIAAIRRHLAEQTTQS